MTDLAPLPLYLYTTLGCHLCELAVAELAPLLERYDIALMPVEIADDDALVECYGMRIPVIRLEGVDVELGWPFDSGLAEQYLQAMLAETD
ncbi:glutaredoxin family protein [Sinobacterium norvegicum]|uniref:glutaredoxin family protein n=1 Tax=Sinobacterium norvegicum TaxID=1641715 RepID=UPI001F243830|nr:glutaredoxin family protein [Sinobacterium norvegicum]